MGRRDESIQGLHPASTGVMRVTNAAEGGVGLPGWYTNDH